MRQLAGGDVQRPFAEVQPAQVAARSRSATLRAAQQATNAGEQFAQVAGLGQEVVGTALDAVDAFDFVGKLRVDEDRYIGGLAQLAQQFEAIAVGQAEIEDDDARRLFKLLPHRRSGRRMEALDAGGRQGRAQDMAGAGVAFNDERGLRHGFHSSHTKSRIVIECLRPDMTDD